MLYISRIVKLVIAIFLIICSLTAFCFKGPNNNSKFEFSKSIFKVKGTVKKADGSYVIIPADTKGEKFIPAYLPEEYKKNGLEVTFDGDLGTADKAGTALNIHKIWVAYDLKEKYKLVHKSYDLN